MAVLCTGVGGRVVTRMTWPLVFGLTHGAGRCEWEGRKIVALYYGYDSTTPGLAPQGAAAGAAGDDV